MHRGRHRPSTMPQGSRGATSVSDLPVDLLAHCLGLLEFKER